MRHAAFICAVAVLSLTRGASAQDWVEFSSVEDGFKLVFPTQPQVQPTTFTSQYGYTLPSKSYTAESGQQRFSVTVVDYRRIQDQGIARMKACPQGAEPCRGGQVASVIGEGYWRQDVRGAITNALFSFIKRDAEITQLTWDWQDLVEGVLLQLTNNADKSRSYVSISMHDNRLYIVEAVAPAGYPPPAAFQQTLGYVDAQGNGVRYQRIYSAGYHGLGEYPVPPRAGQGGGGPQQQQQPQPPQGTAAPAAPPAPSTPQAPAGPRVIVSYVEVAPGAADAAAAVLKAYRDASRKENGHARVEVLQRIGMPGHFVVSEEWHDEASWKAHRSAASATQLREKLGSVRVSPYDERMHTGMTREPAKAGGSEAVTVVTHVDVVPAGVPKAREMLQAQAAASRTQNGNLQFDVLQGIRMNHFTVMERWADERAYQANVAAPHTKTLRDVLQQLSPDAGLYDERLFRAVR
jgi:quinol monooxygenase YgiN